MRLPGDTERISIIGATGTGKTQAALWQLSGRNYHQMPWIVYNFKEDDSIDSIPGSRNLKLNELPIKDGKHIPGVYITHPLPDEGAEVEAQMWAIWKVGGIGVYVDEGYMIGKNNRAFRALLTQGRSKRVPMIILTQRPVYMDKFVLTESEYYQVFRLRHKIDVKNTEQFVPVDLSTKLPPYHSYYYDVAADNGNGKLSVLKPVPPIEEIHKTFERRLLPKVQSL